MKARWNEAKHKLRLAVVKFYVAYLQARQASKIAAYRMQKFAQSNCIASLHSQASLNHLANPDYVAAATKMLNTSTQERLALEELAACIGLSSQAAFAVILSTNSTAPSGSLLADNFCFSRHTHILLILSIVYFLDKFW